MNINSSIWSSRDPKNMMSFKTRHLNFCITGYTGQSLELVRSYGNNRPVLRGSPDPLSCSHAHFLVAWQPTSWREPIYQCKLHFDRTSKPESGCGGLATSHVGFEVPFSRSDSKPREWMWCVWHLSSAQPSKLSLNSWKFILAHPNKVALWEHPGLWSGQSKESLILHY